MARRRPAQNVDTRVERGAWGTWQLHLTDDGSYFAEYRSHAELLGWPLLHYTRGIDPQTGRRKVAKGVIAVGRLAVGVFAFGHASCGLFAFGQAALGLLFGLGQACLGVIAVGQISFGGVFGIGQLATGETAIGQLAAGNYVMAQLALGRHCWTPEQSDPEAVARFEALWRQARQLAGH